MANVGWSPEDDEYVGTCLEFPSLSHLDSTSEKAWRGIHRLVADVVEDMLTGDERPPEPLSMREYSGKFLVRLPPARHRELATEAAEAGVSLNRLISDKLAR